MYYILKKNWLFAYNLPLTYKQKQTVFLNQPEKLDRSWHHIKMAEMY